MGYLQGGEAHLRRTAAAGGYAKQGTSYSLARRLERGQSSARQLREQVAEVRDMASALCWRRRDNGTAFATILGAPAQVVRLQTVLEQGPLAQEFAQVRLEDSCLGII